MDNQQYPSPATVEIVAPFRCQIVRPSTRRQDEFAARGSLIAALQPYPWQGGGHVAANVRAPLSGLVCYVAEDSAIVEAGATLATVTADEPPSLEWRVTTVNAPGAGRLARQRPGGHVVTSGAPLGFVRTGPSAGEAAPLVADSAGLLLWLVEDSATVEAGERVAELYQLVTSERGGGGR